MYAVPDAPPLRERDLRRIFSPGDSISTFRDVEGIPEGTRITVGDRVRFLLVSQPSYFDRLFDDAQENAEEHVDECRKALSDLGVIASLVRVEGVDLGHALGSQPGSEEWQGREAYLIELEAVAFVATPDPMFDPETGIVAGTVAGEAGAGATLLRTIAASGVLVGLALVAVTTVTVAVSGSTFENVAFYVAIVAVALAVAAVARKAG